MSSLARSKMLLLSLLALVFPVLPVHSEVPSGGEINPPPIREFDALEGNSPCKVLFFKTSASFCGQKVTQASLTSWTMLPDNREGCAAIGICYWRSISFSIGYKDQESRKAVLLRFVNQKTSEKFFEAMSLWESGKLSY